MARLTLPDSGLEIDGFEEIRAFLAARGIRHEHWPTRALPADASQDDVLAAYAAELQPYMEANGYRACDVVHVDRSTPDVQKLRARFLPEHVHSEDEVRFFIDGEGDFYFNAGEPVIRLTCSAGDLISVPAGMRHWFDFRPERGVRVIRIFTDPAGWVAQYSGSGVERRYVAAEPA